MTQPKIEGVGHGVPRMLYASDGSNWYAILVDSDGHVKVDVVSAALGTDGATATNQTTMITALQLIDDLRNALGSVATDKVLVASKSGDKIFGFESIVEGEMSVTDLPAGSSYIGADAVPSGKIRQITRAGIMYHGTVPTAIQLIIQGLAGNLGLIYQASPISDHWYYWDGQIWAQYGDYVRGYVVGATLHDWCYVRYCGVQMNVP